MRWYPSWIAGIKYTAPDGTDRGKYCARNLSVGAVLDLVLEPDNPHSRWAVAIKHQGHHLGYVPARHDWVGRALRDVRALNALATDRQNYALVLDAALRITSARGSLNAIEVAALERLRTVGKKHGWI